MRLYIAGPRSEIEDYNRAAFIAGATHLRRAGHWVLSPVELDMPEDGMAEGGDGTALPEDVYVRGLGRCLAAMLDAGLDGIALLPGWEDSRGAQLEVAVALGLGWDVFTLEDGWGPGAIALEPLEDPVLVIEDVLQEAGRLVAGDRKGIYGHPAEFGSKVAGAWREAFGWDVDAFRVQLAMVIFKAVRADASREHRDNLTDIAGYARTAETVQARDGVAGFVDLRQ